MVSSDILQRVIQIKYGTVLWTGFTIDLGSKQYIITAKHVFSQMTAVNSIEFLYEGQWSTLSVTPIFCENSDIDIVALDFWEWHLTPQYPLDYWIVSMSYSQDVYFLGFPYWLRMDSWAMNNQLPFPFVKKGIVSSFDFEHKRFYIDAHNNSWFSGWPVIFNTVGGGVQVSGVIHGFIPDTNTGENSGIAIAYNLDSIIDAIYNFH